MSADGFDVIGDVHAHAAELRLLLTVMGYAEVNGVWRHPRRLAVFAGDVTNRGPAQAETLAIVRAMVDAGAARAVMGNHEFNVVAYCTPDPDNAGEFLRRHTPANARQHEVFLSQLDEAERREAIAWFMTMPLWLDLGGLRVVHACWDAQAIEALADLTTESNSLTPELLVAASRPGSPERKAVAHLLEGPEVPVPVPIRNKDGDGRATARMRWWDPTVATLRSAALIRVGATTVGGASYPELDDEPVALPVEPYADDVPVIFGHYSGTGSAYVLTDWAACVDCNIVSGGPLVAYRWSGETTLSDDNFVSTADAVGSGQSVRGAAG